ncbi:720_t:CDS:1, partial [Dentiscutata erythropus]
PSTTSIMSCLCGKFHARFISSNNTNYSIPTESTLINTKKPNKSTS